MDQLILVEEPKVERRSFRANKQANFNLTGALTIVGIVVGVILAVSVLAAMAPSFFGSVKNLTVAFTAADTGSELANNILGVVGVILPLILVFGFVGLVIFAAQKMKKGY